MTTLSTRNYLHSARCVKIISKNISGVHFYLNHTVLANATISTLFQRIRGLTTMRYTNRIFTYLLTYFLFNSSNVSIILNVSKYVTSTLTHTVSLFLSSSNSLYDAASYKIRTDVKD